MTLFGLLLLPGLLFLIFVVVQFIYRGHRETQSPQNPVESVRPDPTAGNSANEDE